MIKVIAIQKGYYNHLRRAVGDEFHISDKEAFSDKWMKKADGKDVHVAKRVIPPEADVVAYDDDADEDVI